MSSPIKASPLVLGRLCCLFFPALWDMLGANMALAYQEFLYLSLDGSVGPHARVCSSSRRRVNFSGSCCVARPQRVGFPDAPAVSGVCVRWSSWFSAQPRKTKPGLGWQGRNAARRQTQLERKEAAPGAGRTALPSHPCGGLLFSRWWCWLFKVLDFWFSLE